MATQQELLDALKEWTAKLDDPAVKEKFAGFEKTLQFNFTDQPFNIRMVFAQQACALEDGPTDSPDIVITTSSDTIMGITHKKIKPIAAFMTGKLKAKGNMMDMLKIQLLMK
jgi:putative sterol carrier protein